MPDDSVVDFNPFIFSSKLVKLCKLMYAWRCFKLNTTSKVDLPQSGWVFIYFLYVVLLLFYFDRHTSNKHLNRFLNQETFARSRDR